MVLFSRLTLLSLVVTLLLSSPEVETASGAVGAGVDETPVWNQVMLDAIVASTLGNPQTIRMAATVNTAMFDARNGVSRTYTPIFVTQTAPPGTHRRAAVVQAAYVTLKAFYPAQASRFDNQRASSLAEFKGDVPASIQRGIDWARRSRTRCWRGGRPMASATRCLRSTAPARWSGSGSPRPVPAWRRATSPSPRPSC
jgi:hypothetical protein